MSGIGGWHYGRGWTGTATEDACPCPQELCGLVDFSKADPDCPQHRPTKTVRQGHPAGQCPANDKKTKIADIIMSMVVWQGREGTGVTSADREDAEYQLCAEAADKIVDMFTEEVSP